MKKVRGGGRGWKKEGNGGGSDLSESGLRERGLRAPGSQRNGASETAASEGRIFSDAVLRSSPLQRPGYQCNHQWEYQCKLRELSHWDLRESVSQKTNALRPRVSVEPSVGSPSRQQCDLRLGSSVASSGAL